MDVRWTLILLVLLYVLEPLVAVVASCFLTKSDEVFTWGYTYTWSFVKIQVDSTVRLTIISISSKMRFPSFPTIQDFFRDTANSFIDRSIRSYIWISRKTSSTMLLRRLAMTRVFSNNAPWFPPRSFSLVASSCSPALSSKATNPVRGFINSSLKIQSFSPLLEPLLSDVIGDPSLLNG